MQRWFAGPARQQAEEERRGIAAKLVRCSEMMSSKQLCTGVGGLGALTGITYIDVGSNRGEPFFSLAFVLF